MPDITPPPDPEAFAPGLGTTIEGINFDENAAIAGSYNIPPDPNGAAGPAHVVSIVNASIEWHTKAGVEQNSQRLGRNATNVTGSFFAPLNPVNGTFDPKIIYDPHAGRFVAVALERQDIARGDGANTSRLLVAVSDDSDPNGTWHYLAINTKLNIGGVDTWIDDPGVAVDTQAIYVTGNMYSFGVSNVFQSARLWIINKAPLYSGGAGTFTIHNPYAGAGIANPTMPAQIFGTPPANVGTFLVSYSGIATGSTDTLQIVRVNNPLTAPAFFHQYVLAGDNDNSGAAFPEAPQAGSAQLINTGDRRVINAVWRNNALYLCASIVPGAAPNAGQATVHWWKLNTTILPAITVADQGDIGGEDIAAGTHTFYPSIAVDAGGNIGIGFAASGPGIFPGAYYTGRLASDAAGTVQSTGLIAAGQSFYYRALGGARNRWGDYSAISLDPADNTTFWVFNEYALPRGTILATYPSEDGRWGTRWGSFALVPPNAAPVVAASAGSLTCVENQAATPVDPALAVTDSDSANLVGGTVAITANFASGQDVLSFDSQGGITGSYNPANGVLTLTGTAAATAWQAALRTVTYFNSSDNPSTAARTITFTVDDGAVGNNLGSGARTVAVTAVNDPPALAAIGDPPAILEDAGAQTINLSGISAGGGEAQTLTVTATSGNTALIPNPAVTYTSPNATGALSYTPVANASGSALITVTVDDGQGANNTVTRTFTVIVTVVNDPPALAAISDPAAIMEDAGAQTVNLSGINAGPEETQTLTVTATSDNPALIPNPAVTYNSPDTSGALTYTPVPDAFGSAKVTVTIDDGQAANHTVVRAFTVIVTAVNDAPSLAAISNPAPIPEDSAEQTINLSGISAGGGESQTLTVSAVSDNPSLIPHPGATYLSPGATGSLTYTPVPNAFGAATITVTVDDGQAANHTATRTFTINVTAVNDAPTLAAISDPAPIPEDAAKQTINLTGISAGGGETQTLTVSAVSDNPSLIPNPGVTYISPVATGSLTYTPVPNVSGSAAITVTVDDGQAANHTAAKTFMVIVTAVNDPPTLGAISDPAPISEDTGEQTISLTGIGPGGGETQSLTVSAVSNNLALIPNPVMTYASPDAAGLLKYTPVANAFGSATIAVTVDDGQAANHSMTLTFTVNVTAVNDPPTLGAISDPAAILENAGAQTLDLAGISAGAGESQTLTITATSNNTGLIPNPTVSYASPNSTGSLSFTPVAGTRGSAVITVTVNDGQADSSTITRSFMVTVIAPVIAIEQPPGTMLADGTGNVDFGTRLVGTDTNVVFTVRNAGTANLAGFAITFDGVNAGDFSVTASPAGSVAPGGSTSLTVRFAPAASGQRHSMLHVASNDPDASPFDIALTGTGITPLELWRQANFGTTANTGEAANTSDPNRNGIANIVEYALSANPTAVDPGQSALPAVSRGGTGCLQLSFRRYPDRTDVTLTVQAADSPGGPWMNLSRSIGGGTFTVLTAGADATETGTGSVREVKACDLYNISDPAHPRRFMKLEVTQP